MATKALQHDDRKTFANTNTMLGSIRSFENSPTFNAKPHPDHGNTICHGDLYQQRVNFIKPHKAKLASGCVPHVQWKWGPNRITIDEDM
jgi:hypothetical protein